MTPDEILLKEIANQANLINQNNEYAKETILLLREIIPNELKEKVTSTINLEKLKAMFEKRREFLKQNYSNHPLYKILYETGRADGKFETVLALLLDDKKIFNKQSPDHSKAGQP